MSYNGQDLDLRTRASNGASHSQALPNVGASSGMDTGFSYVASLANARASGQTNGRLSIWVDKMVLRLCNQAYDLASVLGAQQVTLAHLVHAMTQFEATSEALYELNVHVSSLKHETTAIIMEEFPATDRDGEVRDGKSSPRKSEEFEELLSRAADMAYLRRSPVVTADIIDALFDMSQDNDPRKLLHRDRGDFELRDTADPSAEMASSVNQGGSKFRVSAGSRPIGHNARIPTGVPTVTDSNQNRRMDEIERAIVALSQDLARNRTTFGSLMAGLGQDKPEWPSEPVFPPRPSNGHDKEHYKGDASEIAYLVSKIERSVEAKFNELSRGWSVLGDRLKSIEAALDDGDGRQLQLTPEIEARLKTLTFSDDRLGKLESLLSALPQRFSEMSAKMEKVERLVQDSPEGNFEMAPVIAGLRDVEAGMRGVGGQIREVDSRAGDLGLAFEDLSERQKRMEDLIVHLKQEVRDEISNSFVGRPDGTDTIAASVSAAVMERFAGLFNQLQGRMGELEVSVKTAAERPPMVVDGASGVDNSYLTDAVGKMINNQHTLASSLDEWRQDILNINARMDKLESKPFVTPVANPVQGTVHQSVDGWTRFKIWLFGTPDWYGVSWDNADRSEDRGWMGQRRTTTEPNAAVDSVYDRNAYDNQRA